MPETPHYFIGFKVSDEIGQWLTQIQENLTWLPYQIWTSSEDFHVTLKFLGAVETSVLNKLDEDLYTAELGAPCLLSIGSLGFFGPKNRPRVMWAGVSHNEHLMDIYTNVENIAKRHHFSSNNQTFRPHITLAKKWAGTDIAKDKLLALQDLQDDCKTQWINSIGLFRVEPAHQPRYVCVTSYRLKG